MDAYISGSSGIAVQVDGTAINMFKAGTQEFKKIRAGVLSDLRQKEDCVHLANTSKSEIKKKLYRESTNSDCLTMFLMLFDSRVSIKTKQVLVTELDDIFIDDPESLRYVNQIVFTRNLDLYDAASLQLVLNLDSKITVSLLKILLDSQTLINEISIGIKEVCGKYNFSNEDFAFIEGFLAKNGVLSLLSNKKLNLKYIQQKIAFDLLCKLRENNIQNAKPLTDDIFNIFKPHTIVGSVEDISNDLTPDNSFANLPHKRARKSTISSSEAKVGVDKQIRSVYLLMRSSKHEEAKTAVETLVASQLHNDGHGKYAALSLCSLSEYAKKLQFFDLQYLWAVRATEVAPDDYRTYGHAGDASLHLERFEDALNFFDKSMNGDVNSQLYGLTGKARVFREKHDLWTALKYINEACHLNEVDHNALACKAEITKGLGKYTDAIDVYKRIQAEFPSESRGMIGEASVLSDLKKYKESLNLYTKILELFPDDETSKIVNFSIAYINAKLGNFTTAKVYLDKGFSITSYEDYVPDLTKSRILNLEGKSKEAISYLTAVCRKKPHFKELHLELLHLLLVTREYSTGLDYYHGLSVAVKHNPLIKLKYGLTLKGIGRFESALKVIDEVKTAYPKLLIASIERAKVLKEKGDYWAARKEYESVLVHNSRDSRALIGIQFINAIEEKAIDLTNVEDVENKSYLDIDSANSLFNSAILRFSSDRQSAKKDILLVKNTKLNIQGVFGAQVNSFLSIASLSLNQKNAAQNQVKKVTSFEDAIQKAIIYGLQGKKDMVLRALNTPNIHYPHYAKDVKKLVIEKFLEAKNDPMHSIENIQRKQLKMMYIAA
ncbi:tetratricopeptide repeat protein [Pseudoalteromonas sp. C8]|uniref:tetratricopeptide repeat protein n=1 Tax=Pseudoalteromonas sp. C8 TaxID=2686345 RepID=UPI0013FD160D|nr:tetratricopeptide repeat protein [Pseudoalteromonas sp. C8]